MMKDPSRLLPFLRSSALGVLPLLLAAPTVAEEPSEQPAQLEAPAEPAHADLPLASMRSPLSRSYADEIEERATLCSTVCSPSEACIDGRCVEACDPDCREGTICTEFGTCVPLPQPLRPRWTEAEVHERLGGRSVDRTSVIFVDPVGVAFQGVQIGYEWGAVSSFIVSARLMNTGFMSYSNEPLTEFEHFEYGYGLSFMRRYYEGTYGNLRGFYYGFGAEAQAIAIGLPYDALRGTIKVALMGHLGYRWAWEGFTFGFGPVLGMRVPVYSTYISKGDGACDRVSCPLDSAVRFEGQLSVELGIFP